MTTDSTTPLHPPIADAATPAASVPLDTTAGPRVRWAGIVWGAVFAALAVAALVTIGSEASRDALHDGILGFDPASINPGTVWGAVALIVGVILLLTGGLALIRHAQRRAGS